MNKAPAPQTAERPPPLNEKKVLGWLGVIVLSCVTLDMAVTQFFAPEHGQDPSLIACGLVVLFCVIIYAWITGLCSMVESSDSALDTVRNQNAARDAKFAKAQQVDHALRGWEDTPPLKFED